MDGLECPVTARRRDRVLSDDELAKVWHAADDGPFGHVLKLLILTGARREEITQLLGGARRRHHQLARRAHQERRGASHPAVAAGAWRC